MPKEIELNYDSDPPFTQQVRDDVQEILRKCVPDLVVTWVTPIPADVRVGKVGPDKWRFKLKSTLDAPKTAGQTGDWSINMNWRLIINTAALDGERLPAIALANSVCHEIVVHGFLGLGHGDSGDGREEVDRDALTDELYKGKGRLSDNACEAFKKALGI